MGPGTKPLTLSPRERGEGGRRRKANSHDRNVIEGLGVAHEAFDVVVKPLAYREHAALLILYGPAVRHDALQAIQRLRGILRLRDPIGQHEEGGHPIAAACGPRDR